MDQPEHGHKFTFAAYFENEVLRKRPYIQKSWCIRIIYNPERVEVQANDRVRFWGPIEELDGRYLRVITLGDRTTILNAFPDRRYKP